MIELIIGDFLPYIIAGIGALASVVVAYFRGRSSANASCVPKKCSGRSTKLSINTST